MKRKRLLWFGLAAVVVLLVVVGIVVARAQSGYTKVVTGKAVREDILSQISGTGQIKPRSTPSSAPRRSAASRISMSKRAIT